jgi:O-antigen ligase
MPISAEPAAAFAFSPTSMTFRASTLAGVFVAIATVLSTIVFSEPAIADALMLVVIVILPVLRVLRFGKAAFFNYAAWLALFALGFAGTMLSTTFDTAFVHQLVTLFLASGAFVIAGYVAEDPEPRATLVLTWYVAACLIATAAAFIGYFRLIPSTYDLFTNYDRARGTFKDPNVYSAALAPAIVSVVWVMLRGRPKHALIAAVVTLPLVVGLLISFSRGAWSSTVLSISIMIGIILIRSRRRSDFTRFWTMSIIGAVALACAIGVATQLDQVRDLLDQRANLDQGYDEGPDGRFGGQAKARALILEHPFGIGTHTFRDTYHHEEPHNVYLSMFLNAGWLGGMLYIVSVLGTLYVGFRNAFRNTRLQGPAVIAVASFAGLAFEGFVIDNDHWRHFFLMAGLIWGIADAAQVPVESRWRRDDVKA